MKTKISIFILSIFYCAYLLILLCGSHYKSNTLNSLNSKYYYENGFLAEAIDVEPSNAEYHMYYGLELIKTLPKDKLSVQNQLRLARKELLRAAKLKPYNEFYKKTCNAYAVWIDEQL